MNQSDVHEMYRRYGFLIYGRCIRILRSHEDAQDATQVVFMKLIEQYDSIRDKEKVVPWIFRAATNHCFNQIRYEKKFVDTAGDEELPCYDDFAERFSARQLVRLVMEHHGRGIRDAVYYTYVEELDQEEIRKLTGQSPATVRRNLKRFRDSLPRVRKRLGI